MYRCETHVSSTFIDNMSRRHTLPEDYLTCLVLPCVTPRALTKLSHQALLPLVLPVLPCHVDKPLRPLFVAETRCYNRMWAALDPKQDRALAVPSALVSRKIAAFANIPNQKSQRRVIQKRPFPMVISQQRRAGSWRRSTGESEAVVDATAWNRDTNIWYEYPLSYDVHSSGKWSMHMAWVSPNHVHPSCTCKNIIYRPFCVTDCHK